MGYHHTTRLTRAAAEKLFIDKYLENKGRRRREEVGQAIRDIPYLDRPYLGDRDIELSDENMLSIYHSVDDQLRRDDQVRKARIKMAKYDDVQLENALEALSNEIAGGHGTDRYHIDEGATDHE